MRSTTKNFASAALIVILAIVLVCTMGFSMFGGISIAADTGTIIPLENETISVGHMSDIHYFPLQYCYQKVKADNYTKSDFYHSTTGDTKLVLESGMVLNTAIEEIIADGKTGAAPQYLIASGDLSKNGERVALIDVANTLRYLQNSMRDLGGKYANFQVFATVGNHDLYNHNGALYEELEGKSRPADMVTAMQFAMIFAGLGFPNVSLKTPKTGRLTLTDYLPEEYWYSEFTGTAAGAEDGYIASDNAPNLDISYYSPAIAEIASSAQKESSDIFKSYLKIGDDLNQLTYFASLTDNDHKGYSFAIIDSTDREATDTGALVRISQAEYNALTQKPTLYLDKTGNIEIDLDDPKTSGDVFTPTSAVYRRTPVQHITGGRITTACLDWLEKQCEKQNNQVEFEETIISSFHHNVLAHFEQEDDILKDFTLYNWEYTAKRLLDMGIRYALTGHMHASDAMTYTDAEGRTLYDFETGSTISYASPRRYLSFTRNNCDGKLGEQLISQVHILGDITEKKSNHIAGTATWQQGAYDTAIADYKAAPDADSAEKWQAVVNSNPDYLTYIIRYDDFAKLTDNFQNKDSLYNDFISEDIYGIIVDRMVDHFITQSTIDGLLESVHSMLLGFDNTTNTTANMIFGFLGLNANGAKNAGTILDKGATYMINVILNDLYDDDKTPDHEGYPYNGDEYDTALDYVLAIVNDILDLEYGDEKIGDANDLYPNPNRENGNVGKLKVREMASFIMMSHSAGNEINLKETDKSINDLFGNNDADYGTSIYRYKQPTNPVYRRRMLAAIQDFDKGLKDGTVVQTLLDMLLNPLLNNEDSLIKTLLDYKFDFSKAGYTEEEYKIVEALFKDKLNAPDLISLVASFLNVKIDASQLNLSFKATGVSLNEILDQLFPIAKPLIGDMLGFNMVGDNIIQVVENLLGDYVTDSFKVGLGGIASNIVMAFATDVYPDMEKISEPAGNYELQPYTGYTYAGQKMSYVSSKNVVSTVGADFNAANQDNGRVPSRVTANFDTKNGTNAFTIKFYTAEDVYGTFKYKTTENGEWTTLSTSKADAIAQNAVKKTDYFDAKASKTTNGIKVEMLTQTKPVYLPLIDLGLLCLTHAEVDYDIDKNTKDVPYKYGERDNAPKNSIVYWNVTTVTVTGLKPDTTYYYDLEGSYVNSNTNTTASFSFVDYNKTLGYDKNYFTFTTAKDASADKFEFLTIADIQGMIQGMYTDSFKAVEALLANENTKNFDFILNAGDMCDNGKNFNQWGYALNTYQKLFANTSMFFAAGNHESGSSAMANFFNYNVVGKQSTLDGIYYSFDYGNAHFTVLNTNDADGKGLGTSQFNWLSNDLKNSNAKWKFVLMHKSLYSGGSHSTDSEVVAMRTQLQKLFADNGVSIVFGGHDHTYTTTYLVDKDGNATDKSDESEIKFTGNGGVLYITLGTMGTKFYEYKNNDGIKDNFDEDKSILETLTSQTFGKVSIDGDVLTYTGYKYNSATGVIEKIGENKLTPAPKPEANAGLSTGAKVAIGVVVPLVVLAIVAVVVVVVLKKQQEKKKQEELLRKKKLLAIKRAKALAAEKAAEEAENGKNGEDDSAEDTAEQTAPEQNE